MVRSRSRATHCGGARARLGAGVCPYNNVTATVKSTLAANAKNDLKARSMSWQVREFEKLQGELADVMKSSLDEARRQILIEQL